METPVSVNLTFHKSMKVKEARAVHSGAETVLSDYHLGECNHCRHNDNDTLEQVCRGYGIPFEELLGKLNQLTQ